MKLNVGIFGVALACLSSLAWGYATSYTGVAMPGSHNGWSTTPTFTLVGDGLWQQTNVTVTTSSGEFKFAANGSWTVNWGGNVAFLRAPGAGVAGLTGGANMTYTNFATGIYDVTFDENSKEFTMTYRGTSAPPSPPTAITSVHLYGSPTAWATNDNYRFTKTGTVWTLTTSLSEPITFGFLINGTNTTWAAPCSISMQGTNVSQYAAGSLAYFNFTPMTPGDFLFTFQTNGTFSIAQTSYSATISAVTVLGSFLGSGSQSTVVGNMRNTSGTKWESTHDFTNRESISGFRFIADGSLNGTWGAPATSAITNALPASGTLTTNSTSGVTLRATAIQPGRYTVEFNTQSGAFAVRQTYLATSGKNLLANPSFETVDSRTPPAATGWNAWPTGGQVAPKTGTPYDAHSGNYAGVLQGKVYSDWNDTPSYSQDVAITGNTTYRLSAWMRVTSGWSETAVVTLRLEWRDGGGTDLSNPAVAALADTTPGKWQYVTIEGTAPSNAVQAHVVLMASGVGAGGVLVADDVELLTIPNRLVDFSGTSQGPATGQNISGWTSDGTIVYNVPSAAPAAGVFFSQYVEGTGNNKALEIFNGTTNRILSTAGATNYWIDCYDNGSATVTTSIHLTNLYATAGGCFLVCRPVVSTNAYPPDAAIRASIYPSFRLETTDLTFNGDDVLVLRNGAQVLDRIGIPGMTFDTISARATRDHTLRRKFSITNGAASFNTTQWHSDPCDSFEDLGSHSLDDPNAPYFPGGNALRLSSGQSLESGEFADVVGDISFWYRCETNVAAALTIQISTDGTTWMTCGTFSNLTATNYTYLVQGMTQHNGRYVRILHAGGGPVRIDDILVADYAEIPRIQNFESWPAAATTFRGWSFSGGSIVPTNGMTGSRAGRLVNNGTITTPAFADGIGEVAFWASPAPADPEETDTDCEGTLYLEFAFDGSNVWTTATNYNITQAESFSSWFYFTNNPTQARLRYVGSAEVVMDVDNVEARIPALYRNQNFDGWPYQKNYASTTHQGWSLNNAAVDATQTRGGMSARLNSTTGSSLTSPGIPNGIGSISFWACCTDASPNSTIQIRISTNGTAWSVLSTHQVTSADFRQYSVYYSNTTARFVQLYHSAGTKTCTLDDVSIGTPAARPTVTITPSLSPSMPAVGDNISVLADVLTRSGATILSVSCSNRIGSTAWRTTNMLSIAYGTYQSPVIFANATKGLTLRYNVTVRYAGIGAAPNSTGYTTNSITTATVTNRISETEKGMVWINEIAYAATALDPLDLETWTFAHPQNHEFIELCGVAGTTINNWTIQLALGADSDIAKYTNSPYASKPVYAEYRISHTFADENNGHGFYVIGDTNAEWGTQVNQRFTRLVPTSVNVLATDDLDHLRDSRGVIRLLNEYSNIVYALSYNGYADGATATASQGTDSSNSVSLTGTGYEYSAFTRWVPTNYTAGVVNNGQTLESSGGASLASIWHIPTYHFTSVDGEFDAYMRNPLNAPTRSNLAIYVAFTNDAYTLPGGTLHHTTNPAAATWAASELALASGSLDSNNIVYARASIAGRSYPKGCSAISYVIEFVPSESAFATTYIGYSDEAPGYFLTNTLAAAKASPFTFSYILPVDIYIDSISGTNNVLTFHTTGNELPGYEPYTHFVIRSSDNLFAATNTWATNATFTGQTPDAYGDNSFTFTNTSPTSSQYFRIDAVWP